MFRSSQEVWRYLCPTWWRGSDKTSVHLDLIRHQGRQNNKYIPIYRTLEQNYEVVMDKTELFIQEQMRYNTRTIFHGKSSQIKISAAATVYLDIFGFQGSISDLPLDQTRFTLTIECQGSVRLPTPRLLWAPPL